MEQLSDDSLLRCPTCGATQPPQPECRRCKADLRLYQAALDQRRRWRTRALWHLGQGQYSAAIEAARRHEAASPDEDAARLLAVACLLAGRYEAALAAYENWLRAS